MRQTIIIYIVIAGMFMFISSCSSIPCKNGVAHIEFRGFDSTALETVIMTFNGKSDTIRLSENKKNYPSTFKVTEYDTVNHFIEYPGIDLPASYTVKYELPNIGKEYLITDLENDGETSKYKSSILSAHSSDTDQCYSIIAAYKVNGVRYTTGKTGPSYGAREYAEIIIQR